MQKVEPGNRDTFRKIGEPKEGTFSILTAPEFDEAAHQIAVNKLHELHGLIMQRMADAMKDLEKNLIRKKENSSLKICNISDRLLAMVGPGVVGKFRLPLACLSPVLSFKFR